MSAAWSNSFSSSEAPAQIRDHLGIDFVRIPAGYGIMGASPGDLEAEENERPAHVITVARAFYLARTPLTLAQYRSLCEYAVRPHGAFLAEHAVNYISCEEADEFVARLNSLRSTSERRWRYRLPSEIEWEYACRGGTTTRFSFGDDPEYRSLRDYAWYADNAWDVGLTQPQIVGTKRPNGFGLLDMHGNVWEWTSDGWADYDSILRHGEGARSLATRVLRGGAFCHEARYIRASDRDHYPPSYSHYYTGLRLCLEFEP